MKSGFCVLWGRPNVGKSTLLNALLGRKHVIVSPRPQTTRHRIAGVLHNNEGENYQIVFLDTPGIHVPQHKLGEALVKTARSALQDIECVVFVGDATDKPHGDDHRAAELLKQQLGKQKVPVILALNKCDAVSEQELDTRRGEFQGLFDFDAKLTISAERGDKLELLKNEIVARLPEGDPYFPPDMMGDRSPEFHIEELIREQAMLQLREEVPHSVAVNIEMMEPRKNGTLFIEAFINVERDSQKRIVIGAGGSRIKEIGQSARQEIENLLGRKVFLELRVKVREKWRDNEIWIQRLGYDER
jgi:GTPase